MTLYDTLAIIALAALIHASFQLSVSLLTLLSSHTVSKKSSHNRLLALSGGFIGGVVFMTTVIMCTIIFVANHLLGNSIPHLAWAVVCGLMVGLAVAVWTFYYRRNHGTTLWLPRPFARYLHERTKATTHTAEAFGLGLSSVVAELIFIIAPLTATALLVIPLQPTEQLLAIGMYVAISAFPLLLIVMLVGGGHKISHIQKWRETNKRFLQFAAGSALFILGAYLYVDQVMTAVAAAGAIH